MIASIEAFQDMLQSPYEQSMMTFNFQPIAYTDESWIPGILEKTQFRNLANYDPIHSNAFLLQAFNLNDSYDFDFNDAKKRLVFLPKATLLTLIHWLGLMACAQSLRNVIDKKRVEIMLRTIGNKGYDFLLKKSQFLLKETPSWLQQVIAVDEQFDHTIKIPGFHLFYSLLQDYPSAFTMRCQLMFPKQLFDHFTTHPTHKLLDKALIYRLIHKIIKIEHPECLSLLK